MKCGTSSLHEYLGRHLEIGMSTRKEIDFFVGNNVAQSLDWYKAHFDGTKQVRGESSQNYSKAHLEIYRNAPRRIHALIPKVRMIYLVRDPIERYRSHIAENYIGETDEMKALSQASENYVNTGLYHYQLQAFLEYFSMDQILVVDSDDLRTERLATMNRIFDFLGVARMDDPKVFDFETNANGEDVVPPRVRASLPYRAARKLAPGLLERVIAQPVVRKTLFPGSYKIALSREERARLAERFAPDVAALRALTGQRFAGWQV